MAYGTIDIGSSAVDRASYYDNVGYTLIGANNPANASGILNTFKFWFYDNGSGVKCGTFVNTGGNYFTGRDYESIGSVTAGSLQTFTGKNCDVSASDYLGLLASGGHVDRVASGLRCWSKNEDYFNTSNYSYTYSSGSYEHSFEASGITVPDAPTSVSATDNLTDKVTITWTAGTGETGGHRVYRDDGGGGAVDISGVVAHGTATFDDTTGTAGVTYAYTVKAINDAGLSAASSANNGTKLEPSSFITQIMKHQYIPKLGVL